MAHSEKEAPAAHRCDAGGFRGDSLFSVNIILIILVCGVIGALDTLYLQKKEVEE